MNIKNYRFEEIEKCEMCGDPANSHKVIGQRLNKSLKRKPKRVGGISVSVKKCSACGLIYSSPQPIPYNISDHYGVTPESYWIQEYFKWEPEYFSNEISILKNLMTIRQGMKALDIGAGIGKCMLSLNNAGFDAYGFEPSQPFYERALSKMNISKDKLKMGMIEEVDYEPESFDFISFGAVFEHLYHPAGSLEKALKWLKPGGIIHIEVPSAKYLMSKLANTYLRLIGTNYAVNLSPMHSPFHLYEFTYKSFDKLSARLGYKIVHHHQYVANVMFRPRILHGSLKKIMEWGNSGMQLTVWLKK